MCYLNPKHKAFKKEWFDFIERQKAKGVEVNYDLHTSGHATPKMLASVINAINLQDALYPMHTEKKAEFMNLPIKDEIKHRIRLNS